MSGAPHQRSGWQALAVPGHDMEALAYYNSYFDEAGPENEASVIRELEIGRAHV